MEKQVCALGAEWLPQAMDLVWEVFSAQIAPGCTDDGIEDFWASIDYEYILHRMGDGSLHLWGAVDGEQLIGVCAIRGLNHIQLLFVREENQFQGAGTILLKKALIDCKALDPQLRRVTVDAIADSGAFFTGLGFLPAGEPYEEGGITYTPLKINA